jgi:cytochrome c biogenesis protein CcmG/thiol:disulfide interchange protein DsbE
MVKYSCMRNTLILLLALLIFGVSAAAFAAERAPNFKLEGVDGKTYELREVAKTSKLVLIDFWEVNCKPCKKSMPHIQDFYDIYKPAGLQVLVISRDTTLTIAKVKPFVATEKWTFPVLYDPDLKTSQAFQVKFSPVSFLINQKGEILYQHSGYKPGDEREAEKAIITALELTDEQVDKLYKDAGKARETTVAEPAEGATEPVEGTTEPAEAGTPEGSTEGK